MVVPADKDEIVIHLSAVGHWDRDFLDHTSGAHRSILKEGNKSRNVLDVETVFGVKTHRMLRHIFGGRSGIPEAQGPCPGARSKSFVPASNPFSSKLGSGLRIVSIQPCILVGRQTPLLSIPP